MGPKGLVGTGKEQSKSQYSEARVLGVQGAVLLGTGWSVGGLNTGYSRYWVLGFLGSQCSEDWVL